MAAKKEYSTNEVTVIWKQELCIHSAKCVNGLPSVFDPTKRPWISIEGASAAAIIEQVGQCPSGALSIQSDEEETSSQDEERQEIKIMEKGPYLIEGTIHLITSDGQRVIKEGKTALCRCGASGKKPFCDGSHKNIAFE